MPPRSEAAPATAPAVRDRWPAVVPRLRRVRRASPRPPPGAPRPIVRPTPPSALRSHAPGAPPPRSHWTGRSGLRQAGTGYPRDGEGAPPGPPRGLPGVGRPKAAAWRRSKTRFAVYRKAPSRSRSKITERATASTALPPAGDRMEIEFEGTLEPAIAAGRPAIGGPGRCGVPEARSACRGPPDPAGIRVDLRGGTPSPRGPEEAGPRSLHRRRRARPRHWAFPLGHWGRKGRGVRRLRGSPHQPPRASGRRAPGRLRAFSAAKAPSRREGVGPCRRCWRSS